MDTILIVEDEFSQREMMGDFFRQDGYNILTAGNGEKALDVIKNDSVEVVISDVQMPKMDGIQLVEKISGYKPELPIIMITGYGTVEVAVHALKKGAADFLLKPVDLGKLSRSVAGNLERSQESKKAGQLFKFCRGEVLYSFPVCEYGLLGALARHVGSLILQYGFIGNHRYHATNTAIFEAFSNAVYHGALGVPSEGLREEDKAETAFMEVVSERSRDSLYKDRTIDIRMNIDKDRVSLEIDDKGEGFDWKRVMAEADNPENLIRPYGRGLMIIKGMIGEKNFHFNKEGSCLTLFFKRSKEN